MTKGQYVLDLKFMAIRTIEEIQQLDDEHAVYDTLYKFADSPILRRADDKFLCDIGSFVVFNGIVTRIGYFNVEEGKVNFIKETLRDYEYDVKKIKLLGFTLDNEPILEYNVLQKER
jgi:hypothetical protein